MAEEGASKGRRPVRHHNEEFKRSVVEHWRSSGKTAAVVARARTIHQREILKKTLGIISEV